MTTRTKGSQPMSQPDLFASQPMPDQPHPSHRINAPDWDAPADYRATHCADCGRAIDSDEIYEPCQPYDGPRS
jgi:hypothetical protein